MGMLFSQLTSNRTNADDGGLQYHVTFPTPSKSRKISRSDETPVVFVLGWTGCRDRDLAKYSALYDKKGCITIRYIPSPRDVYMNPDNFRSIALKLLDLLQKLELDSNPLFFHMLSNGGCSVYRYLSKAIASNLEKKYRVLGAVFDSTPAVVTLSETMSAMTNSFPTNRLYKMAFLAAFWLFLIVKIPTDYFSSVIYNKPREAFCIGLWEDVSKDSLRNPQLVLYSTADKICNWKSISKFIEERRKRRISVTSVCWGDSMHVRHYPTHPEEYTKEIDKFLSLCLKRKEKNEFF